MKSAICALAIFLALDDPIGCDKPAPSPKPIEKTKQLPPTHRFENVTNPPSPGLALDTTTGQYCRTWSWVYAKIPNAHDLNELPTCKQLYMNPEEPNEPLLPYTSTLPK